VDEAKRAEIKKPVSRPESIERHGSAIRADSELRKPLIQWALGLNPPFQFEIAKVLVFIVGAGGDEVEALSEPGEVPVVGHADYRWEEKLIGDGGGDQR